MKRVLVIGAHGRTGSLVVSELRSAKNLVPIAGVHLQSEEQNFKNQGIETRVINVRDSVTQIKEQLTNVDAIVIALEGDWMVSLDGKVKVAQAAEQKGIKRLILLSAGAIQHFHDEKRLPWMNDYEEYSAALYYADMYISHSQLDFTIVRPETLTDIPATNKVNVGSYLKHTTTSQANVAKVIVASLLNDNTIRKGFDVQDGKTPIKQAIKSI